MATALRRLALAALLLLLAPSPGTAHVAAGEPVPDLELPALDGSRQRILAPGKLSLLVFFRPAHDRSLDTLQRLAECEKELAKKPLRVVAVVSGSASREEAQATVAEAGVKVPVLVDEGDELYGRLELRQHPAAVLVDRQGKVSAVEPYQKLRYCDVLRARIGYALGELDAAGLEKALHPPRAAFPQEVSGGHAGHYVNLGKKALAKGDADGALRAFEAALALDPKLAGALEGKAAAEKALAKGAKPAPTPAKAPAPKAGAPKAAEAAPKTP